jgi:trk system potassium uptake protein TrkH
MNFRRVLDILARLVIILAAAEILPVAWCLVYGERRAALAFVATAVGTGLLGAGMRMAGHTSGELYRREGVLIVVGGWVLASLSGAVPYLLAGAISSPVDALFESASGFTTTGASILVDIEAAGRGVLFWRSFTQWLGGMGIVVLFVALLSELGPGARFLYHLEVPGPKAEVLHPRVQSTATAMWRIYLLLSVVLTVLLLAAGLDVYDAMTHTFSTLSTGGFSPYSSSIAAYPPLVHLIIALFMVISGVNFSLYYALLRRRDLHVFRDPELRWYLGVLGSSIVLVTIDLLLHTGAGAGRALLESTFQVASILTTTGFATTDFGHWPDRSQLILVALMFVGGCAGSTAGGPKVVRIIVGLRAAFREVRLTFSPSSVIALVLGGKVVPDESARSVSSFLVLWMGLWGIGVLLLSIGPADVLTAATASIATLANVGPGLAGVGPNQSYAFFAGWQKLTMVLLMWLGRLEVFVILALFQARFWRR